MSKPDWDYWLSLRTVKVWEACALSMDLDPSSLTQVIWDLLGITQSPYLLTPQIPPALSGEGFPPPAVRKLYYQRLRILSSNVGDDAPIRISRGAKREVECVIPLSTFAHWTVEIAKWKDLPKPYHPPIAIRLIGILPESCLIIPSSE